MKHFAKKILAIALSVILLVSAAPIAVFAAGENKSELTFGVVSDVHYYPRSLMGTKINDFIEMSSLNSTTSYLSDALLDAALEEYKLQAEKNGLKYVIIPGDLSKNGEYESLTALAQKLKAFEKETGIQVLVINGNHDIRNANAARFGNGKFESVKNTQPSEFREIFADLGYDLADSFYVPPKGEEAGQLSYAATLDGGYRLIAMDGGCYSSDNTSDGENVGETRGAFSNGVLKWALEETKKAKEQGLTVIGMTHFNLVEHYQHEDCTMQAFVIDDWQEVAEKLADAGMHYAFTGHLHFHDIATLTTDNGETITDCATASLVNFPNYFRVVKMDNTAADSSVTAEYQTFDCDSAKQISAYGTTYPKPFKYTSFALNYGGSDISGFADRYVEYFLKNNVCPGVKKAGGFYNYLNGLVDIDSLIDSLFESTDLGQLDGITKSAVKSLIQTICKQLEKKYIDDPEHSVAVVDKVIRKLTSVRISDYACTKYLDTLGFGSKTRPGNLGDAISSVLAYMYYGDEDRSGDDFLNDAMAKLERGETAQAIFDTLVDVVLNDLLKDEILPTLEIDPIKYFGALSQERKIGLLDSVLSSLDGSLGNSPKINAGNIVTAVLALGIADINSLEDLLNYFLDEYMTESQMDTIAYEIYNYLYDFTTDSGPADCNETVKYSGKVDVVPTVEDLRLPSAIAVTFGSDASTSRNISWYTKVSVTGTDIEIVPYSENPVFTGIPTVNGISEKTVRTTREYPGIDFGVFGILGYEFDINRHEISVTGLKPGTKYCYRVGDASKNWWSDIGVIETADNSDSFTFFHMSDSQGGIERQYQVWADTVASAYNMYPDSAFIMHTGDQVDSGTNFKQWSWSLNCASKNLMSSVLMPTTGNHEDEGSSVTNNFMISNLPAQELETGVYYSFDYNNAHIMVLNTNDLDPDGGLSAQQLKWLKNDASSSDKQWKIVALHKAVYSNGSHFDDNDVIGLRTQLSTLMPELGIDLVLQGHDHVYLRTGAMSGNEVVECDTKTVVANASSYNTKINAKAPVYAIDGCAGVKYYSVKDAAATDEQFPRAEKTADANAPVFSAIQIKGDKLFFDAYKVADGKNVKIDSFAISKSDVKNMTSADGLCDVNGDGIVSVVDAKWVLQYVAGVRNLNSVQKIAADANASNDITVSDSKWLLQLVSGLR